MVFSTSSVLFHPLLQEVWALDLFYCLPVPTVWEVEVSYTYCVCVYMFGGGGGGDVCVCVREKEEGGRNGGGNSCVTKYAICIESLSPSLSLPRKSMLMCWYQWVLPGVQWR